ncbi:tRNA uracil 4-sulfurtransferase ThiI [Bengtsoniella intestinalis]|uniref:tRNA uracil 4-sulfurtransferase ThiI n=1 Tax=Bengtsoniella intestinalis TaxID=3073143 RepID=UPI00391F4F31
MTQGEVLLLKLGEVVLKGQNRRSFEDKLVANVRHRLKTCDGSFEVCIRQSTIYVEQVADGCDMEEAVRRCRQVFGVVSVVRAHPCDKEVSAIVECAKTYLAPNFAAAKSFKVESKRADKQFPMNSIQLSIAVGGDLADAFPHVAVDVHNPALTVEVEIREKAAYVHAPALPGAGGLPVGMGGKAVSLLSGGIDSPVSSWMMARRGVQLEMVHFESPPYTSQMAQDKVIALAQALTPYCGPMTIQIVPFTGIQEEIRRQCPEEYFTIIMRRFMMRIAQKIAYRCKAKALITGESLGQVASQTMHAMVATDDVTTMPVLRPVIGMDKVEIIKISQEIGTFETSILPYEDCCTVFTPRHPSTKPKLENIRKAEEAMDIDALVREAVENVKLVKVRP